MADRRVGQGIEVDHGPCPLDTTGSPHCSSTRTDVPARPGGSVIRRRNRLKIAGRWVYPYRAFDQYGQVMAVLAAEKRNLAATRRFFARALEHAPAGAGDDRPCACLPRVVDELLPAACHVMEQYANN